MRIYKDNGFIIRIKQFPDADKLVIFLTKKHGIIDSVAKGASKSSSRKVSSIDLLNHVKASFYTTKGIDLLREIEIINDYHTLKRDKNTSKILLYILEVIDKINASSGQELKAYNLLFDFLELSSIHIGRVQLLLACFEIKLLELAGFSPKLQTYTKTDTPILKGEQRVLSSGQILGYQKVDTGSKTGLITDKIIKVQRFFLENDMRTSLSLKIDNNSLESLLYINRYWIENIIEKRLKSSSLLNY